MPEEIRELILLHSEWKDEMDYLKNSEDFVERQHWLSDFYEKVKDYKEGVPIKIKYFTKINVFERQQLDKDGFIINDHEAIKD